MHGLNAQTTHTHTHTHLHEHTSTNQSTIHQKSIAHERQTDRQPTVHSSSQLERGMPGLHTYVRSPLLSPTCLSHHTHGHRQAAIQTRETTF
mmetsp:Transcript_42945/g.121694  ORF Transcript_42945/g.121694 Transcript_42945/m.121694 type:complete len:92 (-) Transcript_42945:888-1163(-)